MPTVNFEFIIDQVLPALEEDFFETIKMQKVELEEKIMTIRLIHQLI